MAGLDNPRRLFQCNRICDSMIPYKLINFYLNTEIILNWKTKINFILKSQDGGLSTCSEFSPIWLCVTQFFRNDLCL